MTKKPLNTTISKLDSESPQVLSKMKDQVIFSPSSSQQKMKAKFWTKFQPGPLVNTDNISMSVVLDVTKSPQIRKWWAEPGFQDWFNNREEEKEKIKYLFNLGLETVEEILRNPDANQNSKANLIKMLAEMNGYLGKKPVEKFADESINQMSAAQLRVFLERKGVNFSQEEVINVSGSTEGSASEETAHDNESEKGSSSD